MQNVLYYFLAVSVIGAVVCIYDKLAAQRGWTLVKTQGVGLGWGYGADGTLKNHYPKGLRRILPTF